jgi:murein DD-endopeptidase MepM/ murein hydrolase activator NlpD
LPKRWSVFLLGGALSVASCAAPEPARRSARPDVYLPRETEIIEQFVPRNATLDSLLRNSQVRDELVSRAVEAARGVFNPKHLRAGRPYRLVLSLDGLIREFEYQIDADRFLRIISPDRSRPDVLDAEVVPYEKETAIAAIDARLGGKTSSLIGAIEAAGENIQLALDLAEIFSGQVDFNSDLQPGDSFKVLFEKSTRDGEFSSYGAILGAAITVDGHEFRAFRWADSSSGKAAYYDEQGRSLKRFFLKSPLKFEPRITSRFSLRRLHPVHNVYKAHLGVDYGAPSGSAVVAVANGTVVSASYSGGGGNTVHLKHAGGFETYYLHLSSFGPGIRAGTHVTQGQLIGRVGMTGTATGPHLDYRLKSGGRFVNPVSIHSRQAPGDPIPAVHLADFHASRDAMLSRLRTTLAAEAPREKPDAVRAR